MALLIRGGRSCCFIECWPLDGVGVVNRRVDGSCHPRPKKKKTFVVCCEIWPLGVGWKRSRTHPTWLQVPIGVGPVPASRSATCALEKKNKKKILLMMWAADARGGTPPPSPVENSAWWPVFLCVSFRLLLTYPHADIFSCLGPERGGGGQKKTRGQLRVSRCLSRRQSGVLRQRENPSVHCVADVCIEIRTEV